MAEPAPASIGASTRAYEAWLRQQCAVVEPDLRLKHQRLAESPFVFLRGTFYRWCELWPRVCDELVNAPRVLAVGDLHVENFGTWRDVEGRLIWGVNDVDEAHPLPYTQDLVRLATSALLAAAADHLSLSPREACDAILDGYSKSIARGGRPFVLAERHRWLREIALGELRDPALFWIRLEKAQPARGQVPAAALRQLLPRGAGYRVMRRVAGVGSLGRPRFVALTESGGSLVAREAKAALPSACAWRRGEASTSAGGAALIARAVRVADPFFTFVDRWIVRRLAPDCARIEMADLPRMRDEPRLLRAMGWETANLHLGGAVGAIGRDLARRPRRWLERAAARMARAVERDWRDWCA